MYDVMIIDDDQFIRDRLKSIIDWEEIGIRFVCEAQDSETARELFLLHHPKILITDIHIPIISGLELAQEFAVTDPEVRFIIITGYSDFEYAKSTVKLGAIDLISKPIMPDDINASLKKVVAYFEKLKSEQNSSLNMNLLLKESLPMLREKFIYYIIESERNYSSEEILEKFRTLLVDLDGQFHTIVLISPEVGNMPAADIDMALVAVKNISDELLCEAGFKIYSFYDNNYRLNYLLGWDFDNGIHVLEETINITYEKIRFYWSINIHAGIGMTVSDLTKLHAAWHEAFIALNYQEMIDSCPVINYENVKQLDMPIITDNSEIIAQAITCFDNNNLQEMHQLIKGELADILTSSKDYIPAARKFLFEFISPIITESISRGIKTESILKCSNIYEKIFSTDNMQLLAQYIVDFAESISKELFQKRSASKNALIKMAKDFIIANLGNEKLNLEMVSRHISLSSIYFCKLFHKEEGVSFNNYLNLERVNKAKILLSETSLKVFEVGCTTGYGNSKYFNYIFKRIVGITPLEYRNKAH